MTTEPTIPDPSAPYGASPRLSRRSLLAGFGLGAAALAIGKAGGSAGAIAGELNEAAGALAPAHRVSPPTTTTVPTTTEPTATVATVEGEIRFPIIVGEDDYCYVGRSFGACRDGCGRSHEGVDIMADRGLEVIAVVDGVLTKKYEDSGSCGGAGNGWTLTDAGNNVVYKFFHLDGHVEGLEVGDAVTAGQVIGYVGETGTSGVCSTKYNNYHLHFEYRPNDVATNAFNLLDRPPYVTFAS